MSGDVTKTIARVKAQMVYDLAYQAQDRVDCQDYDMAEGLLNAVIEESQKLLERVKELQEEK